jgi:hypothetical protein
MTIIYITNVDCIPMTIIYIYTYITNADSIPMPIIYTTNVDCIPMTKYIFTLLMSTVFL